MSVDLFSESDYSYLAVSVDGKATYLFTIDHSNGGVMFFSIPYVDVFPDLETTKQYIFSTCSKEIKHKYLGPYLVGLTTDHTQICISVITEFEECGYVLGKSVYQVKSIEYFYIRIADCNPVSQNFDDFPVANNHFFCLDLNLSSFFPYEAIDNSRNCFLWNRRWIKMFEDFHVPFVCILLHQGSVSSLYNNESPINIVYILRRSLMNPGTRYIGRGLNDKSFPANECECELLFINHDEVYSYSWIRGSCPVPWKTELSSSLSSPKHIVYDDSTRSTLIYFFKRISSYNVKEICLVSLLHETPKHGELDILSAYQSEVAKINEKTHGFIAKFVQFDINHCLKNGDSFQVIQEFLGLVGDDAIRSGFTRGNLNRHVDYKQKSIFRFNCADSLDRTNLATFYFSLFITSLFAVQTGQFIRSMDNIHNLKSKPQTFLAQPVIDFLGESIMKAGDVVSIMYTNTLAIKRGPINAFLSGKRDTPSDTSITIMRRYHNVLTDPQRQIVIDNWISEDFDVNTRFYLHPKYISLVDTTPIQNIGIIPVDGQIISSEVTIFKFDQSIDKDIRVLFPCDLRVCSISIYAIPQPIEDIPSFSVSFSGYECNTNVFCVGIQIPLLSEPSWIKYDLRDMTKLSVQFPINYETLDTSSFMCIHFCSSSDQFLVGNIKIEVQMSRNQRIGFIEQSKEINKSVKNDLLSYYESTSIGNLLELNSFRVQNGICDSYQNEICISKQFNPFMYDLRSRLLIDSKEQCFLCGIRLTHEDKYGISINNRYCCFLVLSQINDGYVCGKCTQIIDRYRTIDDKKYWKEKSTSLDLRKMPPIIESFIDFNDITSYFRINLVTKKIQGSPNSILSEKGGIWPLLVKKEQYNSFMLCCVTHFVMKEIIFEFSETDVVFSIDIFAPNCIKMNIISEQINERAYKIQTDLMDNMFIKSVLVCLSIKSDINSATLTKMTIFGSLVNYPVRLAGKRLVKSDYSFPKFPIIQTNSTWDDTNRTQEIQLRKAGLVKAISFHNISISSSIPRYLVCVLYHKNCCVNHFHIVIPFSKNENIFTFFMNPSPYLCDKVCLFYLDRIKTIKPHTVSIITI